MVAYGGPTLAHKHPMTPLGSCNAILQSKGSFTVGKILRMGHYAVILQLRFRLFWGVY